MCCDDVLLEDVFEDVEGEVLLHVPVDSTPAVGLHTFHTYKRNGLRPPGANILLSVPWQKKRRQLPDTTNLPQGENATIILLSQW